MPFSFPASPAVSQQSTQNGRVYSWTGYAWELVASSDSRWDLFLPAAPTGLTATAGNAQATLSWTAPTGVIAQAPITDYVVQFSINSGSSWSTFSDGTSTATSATVTGLTNGTAVQLRVAATNGAGTGAYSTASSAVTPTAGTPPGTPTGLSATAGNAQIALAWTAPASAGSSAITGYTVEYTPSGGSPTTVSTGSNATSYTLTSLTNGTAYTVRVAAVNSAGAGSYTAASSSVTPSASVFRAIPTLTSNTSDGTVEANTGTTANAFRLFDGSSSTDYNTQRNSSNTPLRYFQYTFAGGLKSRIGGYTMSPQAAWFDSINTWELSGSDDGTTFTVIDSRSAVSWASASDVKTFTLASPANYSTYRWTVTTDANDSLAGLAAVQLLSAEPSAPTSFTATGGNAQVSLAWTAPSYNGGSAITDYSVQFSSDSGSNWTAFSRTASTTASQVVTGLTNGTAYVFRVAGINGNGTGTYTAASSSVTPSASLFSAAAAGWSGAGTAASKFAAPSSPTDFLGATVSDASFTVGVAGTARITGTHHDGNDGDECRISKNGTVIYAATNGTADVSVSVVSGDVIRVFGTGGGKWFPATRVWLVPS